MSTALQTHVSTQMSPPCRLRALHCIAKHGWTPKYSAWKCLGSPILLRVLYCTVFWAAVGGVGWDVGEFLRQRCCIWAMAFVACIWALIFQEVRELGNCVVHELMETLTGSEPPSNGACFQREWAGDTTNGSCAPRLRALSLNILADGLTKGGASPVTVTPTQAACRGHLDVVQYLAGERGAAVDHAQADGATALMVAASEATSPTTWDVRARCYSAVVPRWTQYKSIDWACAPISRIDT